MALRGAKTDTSEAAGRKAAVVFGNIEKARNFDSYKGVTESVAFRIPSGEKERLKKVFARKGLTLSQAVKFAVYRFAEDIEAGKIDLLDIIKKGRA